MIGIYKIVNPKGKIYIGQSIDIENRFQTYKHLERFSSQTKLYNSIKKYGYDLHIFEIVEECEEFQLNNKERYYQEFYNVISKNGLNCRYVKDSHRRGKLFEETKRKIGLANSNPSEKTRKKLSESKKKYFFTEEHKKNLIKHRHIGMYSEEIKLNMSKSKKSCIGVINIETEEIYHSIRYAAKCINVHYKTLSYWLTKSKNNKSPYRLYNLINK